MDTKFVYSIRKYFFCRLKKIYYLCIMKIKFVADITDEKTNKYLKTIWENSTSNSRKKLLNEMGHSEKYSDMDYNDLTGEIQSKIVMISKMV